MTHRPGKVLPASFFDRTAPEVARDLLGAVVVSRLGGAVTSGRIVETEAYLGVDDPASHAWGGRRTTANTAIYGPPGSWYVYRAYGMHWCINLVTAPVGAGAAVLIRALEPCEGLEMIRQRRSGIADRHLCNGPGKLAQGLGITRDPLDGRMMRTSRVLVRSAGAGKWEAAQVTPRIGITRAADWPLRFVAGSAGQ